MQRFSEGNVRRLISLAQGDLSAFLSSVEQTFQEVYDNMDALEARIGAAYSPETETVVIPESAGSYDGGTETAALE